MCISHGYGWILWCGGEDSSRIRNRVVLRCVQVPSTADLLKEVSVPLALVVCPLAEIIEDKETNVALVDLGEEGPLRCRKCKAYANPFMQFIDNGMKFTCNFCGNTGEGAWCCRAAGSALMLAEVFGPAI